MDKIKFSVMMYCTVMGIIIGIGIGRAIWYTESVEHEPLDLTAPYTPTDYLEDYGVDLKQEGYLILDEEGDVFYVPFGTLENWFLEMNT